MLSIHILLLAQHYNYASNVNYEDEEEEEDEDDMEASAIGGAYIIIWNDLIKLAISSSVVPLSIRRLQFLTKFMLGLIWLLGTTSVTGVAVIAIADNSETGADDPKMTSGGGSIGSL